MSTTEEWTPEQLARGAQHECGHAASSWAQGIPFGRILLRGHHDLPMVEPVGARMMAGQNYLISCCGFIADMQRRELSMRDSEILKMFFGGGADDSFEVDDAATGRIAVRPSRVPAVSPGGDLYRIVVTLPGYPNAAFEAIRIWRDSERFAAECRPAIDALAAAILAQGQVAYTEAVGIAESAMKEHPIPVIPEWARP